MIYINFNNCLPVKYNLQVDNFLILFSNIDNMLLQLCFYIYTYVKATGEEGSPFHYCNYILITLVFHQ